MTEKYIKTNIPGREPIKLIDYYDEFLWYYPNCELVTKKWFVDHIEPDWYILDCGANIGYFSILFSQCAHDGHVFSIEPTKTFRKLEKNLKYNNASNVSLYRLALGNKNGTHTDGIFRLWGSEPEIREYEFSTIDHFMEKNRITKCDCIKIDVDSFDFEVLQGAETTLEKYDPYVVVELNYALSRRSQSNARALEWMAERGYPKTLCLEYENFIFKRHGYQFEGTKKIEVFF